MNTLSKIYKSLSGSKRYVCILCILSGASSLCIVTTIWFIRGIVDSALSNNICELKINSLYLLFITVIWLICSYFKRYFDEYIRANIENKLKGNLIRDILNKDFATVSKTHSADWLNRITTDTRIVAENIVSLLPSLCASITRIVSAVYLMATLIPTFLFVIIPCGIIILIGTYFFRRKLKMLHEKIREYDSRFRISVQEHIENLMVVKAFDKEDIALKHIINQMDDHQVARLEKNKFSNLCNTLFGLLMRGSYIGCAILGGFLILKGKISYGSFVALVQLIGQIEAPLSGISSFIPMYISTLTSFERLQVLSKAQDDVHLEATNNNFEEFGLKNVSFKYSNNSEYVLKNFTMRIKYGQFVAIKGPSGNGKSTIFKLLMSLYDVKEGEKYISFSNHTNKLDSTYRSLFAYVPQGNQLMSGTVKEIVSFNSDDVDIDKLNNALKISLAYNFVYGLKDSINTIIGERGLGLSEGQMQRLAIARAIYSNKPVLLLDESTSALDIKTELNLLENLRKLKDKTILVITHKDQVLNYCDSIFQID